MGEMVEFASNGGTAQGYLARPAGGSGPGVIVIQEWWGLNDNIKDIAERFAAEGFVALAPDLYHGQVTAEPDEAGKLMMGLRITEAEKDLRGSVNYLTQLPVATGSKVGTVGFCMGGALSYFAATKNPSVGACVIFYGGFPGVEPDHDALQAPVLGIYAEKDGFVTPEAARGLKDTLDAKGKQMELHIYPGVDHGFFNDTAEVYDAAAAADSWQKTLAFFRKHLG
jgi:carboxymethylenebutenolidase